MSSNSEAFEFSIGAEAYRLWSTPRGAYNNRRHLKLWESGLFSGWYIWIKFHQNQRYLNFPREQKPPIKGGYMWPAMPIFKLGLAIPNKSHVWKFGSDWLNLSRVIIWIFHGAETPYWGCCKWPAMPIFGLGWAIPVESHLCKLGSDWLSLSRVIVSTNIFLLGRHPLLGGGHIWTVMPIFELGWAIPV